MGLIELGAISQIKKYVLTALAVGCVITGFGGFYAWRVHRHTQGELKAVQEALVASESMLRSVREQNQRLQNLNIKQADQRSAIQKDVQAVLKEHRSADAKANDGSGAVASERELRRLQELANAGTAGIRRAGSASVVP